MEGARASEGEREGGNATSSPRTCDCRSKLLANAAHIRQPRPDSGLGLRQKSCKRFKVFPFRSEAVRVRVQDLRLVCRAEGFRSVMALPPTSVFRFQGLDQDLGFILEGCVYAPPRTSGWIGPLRNRQARRGID